MSSQAPRTPYGRRCGVELQAVRCVVGWACERQPTGTLADVLRACEPWSTAVVRGVRGALSTGGAAGTTTVGLSCGYYRDAYCTGEELQAFPTCPTECADDGDCIESAHCMEGSCEPDVPNGEACSLDHQCESDHCANGFCCDSGFCCSNVLDCPGGAGVVHICAAPSQCEGARGESFCTNFQCGSLSGIRDDTGCGTTTRALTCGLYRDIYCTGAEFQTSPSCPTSCSSHTECIDTAYCSSVVSSCVPRGGVGTACTLGVQCQAGLFCTDGVCCNSSCTQAGHACNMPGSLGTCTSEN